MQQREASRDLQIAVLRSSQASRGEAHAAHHVCRSADPALLPSAEPCSRLVSGAQDSSPSVRLFEVTPKPCAHVRAVERTYLRIALGVTSKPCARTIWL